MCSVRYFFPNSIFARARIPCLTQPRCWRDLEFLCELSGGLCVLCSEKLYLPAKASSQKGSTPV